MEASTSTFLREETARHTRASSQAWLPSGALAAGGAPPPSRDQPTLSDRTCHWPATLSPFRESATWTVPVRRSIRAPAVARSKAGSRTPSRSARSESRGTSVVWFSDPATSMSCGPATAPRRLARNVSGLPYTAGSVVTPVSRAR